MMNNLEQKFYERVPGLLHDISKSLEAIAGKDKAVEPEQQEPWELDEWAFIEKYCPTAGGNDYLGWIDDIDKLLCGEAEPGDSASTGEYASCSKEELREERKRLQGIVLRQAFESYLEQNY